MLHRRRLQLGVLLLIGTPVARVLYSAYAFARQRDWVYIALTIVVLGVLLYSLFAGLRTKVPIAITTTDVRRDASGCDSSLKSTGKKPPSLRQRGTVAACPIGGKILARRGTIFAMNGYRNASAGDLLPPAAAGDLKTLFLPFDFGMHERIIGEKVAA